MMNSIRNENLDFFRVPGKIYLKKGCLPVALEELKYVLDRKKVLIATSPEIQKQGQIRIITDKLNALGIVYMIYDVSSGMTNAVDVFEPDCILAFGSDEQIFLAQMLWATYACPDGKAYFITVPCFAGMSFQVTPVISESGRDRLLFADMTIIDTDLMDTEPDMIRWFVRIALYQAVSACESDFATDYTDGMAVRAIQVIFDYLPKILENPDDVRALEKLASAGTMAGIAFSNACAEFSAESGQHVRCAELLGMDCALLTQKLEAVSQLY